MKYYLKNLFIILLTFVFLFLLFINPEISKQSINTSFNLWLNNLLPSIFPMIIINDILLNYNFPIYIMKILYKPFNKIFKLSYNGIYIFILSMFIGTPTNAILMNDMIKNNQIEIGEINKLLFYCYFSNPLFLFSILSLIGFDKIIIFKIIFSHYISNFIIAFILRKYYISNNQKLVINKQLSLMQLIPKSCGKAINTMITILGIISFYQLLSNHLFNSILIKGILEITTGLNEIIILKQVNSLLLAIILINFGGLSIFTQIKSILENKNANIKFYNYFIGRIFQIILCSVLLC